MAKATSAQLMSNVLGRGIAIRCGLQARFNLHSISYAPYPHNGLLGLCQRQIEMS